jgi:hypothetical protein
MTRMRKMAVGTASGAVSLGLGLALVFLLSDRPPPDRVADQRRAAETVVSDAARARLQDVVVLPPPPATEAPADAGMAAPPPSEPRKAPEVAPLAPRAERKVEIAPLQPRPDAAPAEPPPPPERAAAPAEPAPAPTEPAPEPAKHASQDELADGRVLLRMLETGKGPLVEIAWPDDPAARTRLYTALAACHGMETVLLGPGDRLFAANGRKGEAAEINPDSTSGFVRRPAGALPAPERETITRTRQRHGLAGGAPVRLFPRTVDAALLGGLQAAVGPDYLGRRLIHAHYRLDGSRVSVDRIDADGTPVPGAIALPRMRACR